MHQITSSADIAKLLRQARKAQSLTQLELSGLTGRQSPKAVNAAEQGHAGTELGTFLELAEALGIRLFAELPSEVGPLIVSDQKRTSDSWR